MPLLGEHREFPIAARTRAICRLRWHRHEIHPSWEPRTRSLDRIWALDEVAARIATHPGTVARLARTLVDRRRELTTQIAEPTAKITALVTTMAPALLAVRGLQRDYRREGSGETAGV